VGVSTFGFASSRGEHRYWDGTGLGGTPLAPSHPTHHNVFLLGMGLTMVHNARKVQMFPFPILIFSNLRLGRNRPLLVMKFLEFYLEMPQYCTGFAMLKFEFWH
jgi:hypothetical protein